MQNREFNKRDIVSNIFDYDTLYCAYGSNINLEQMAFRCPKSEVIGVGYLSQYRLYFNVHADIIRTGNKKDIVPVLVWKIHKDDWNTLDMYEGYPSYYIRENVIVTMGDKEYNAIAYIMTDQRRGIYPPSEGYFNGILKGYDNNNMNTDYLYEALDFTYENQTKYNKYYDSYGRKIVI